jgi:hypothetical protein
MSEFDGIDRTFVTVAPDVATDIEREIERHLKQLQHERSVRWLGPRVQVLPSFQFRHWLDKGCR